MSDSIIPVYASLYILQFVSLLVTVPVFSHLACNASCAWNKWSNYSIS